MEEQNIPVTNLSSCGISDLSLDDVFINKPKRISKNPNKKRQRKTKKQIDILEQFYASSSNWSMSSIELISEITGLQEKQVKKWLWDRNLK